MKISLSIEKVQVDIETRADKDQLEFNRDQVEFNETSCDVAELQQEINKSLMRSITEIASQLDQIFTIISSPKTSIDPKPSADTVEGLDELKNKTIQQKNDLKYRKKLTPEIEAKLDAILKEIEERKKKLVHVEE